MARKPTPIEVASTASLVVDTIAEAPFYIPATGQSTRPRHTLKYGDAFAVLDSHGDMGATSGGHDGFFFDDTRFLSRLELRLNGMPPLLLGSNVSDDNSVLNADLTNPDIYADRQLVLNKDTLHIVRTTFLWRGTAYQRLGVHNLGDQTVDVRVSINFGSDFADIFEVRGFERARREIGRASCRERV